MTETRNPLVSVIILNYNGEEVLGRCLDSVFASSYSPYEVIVVDNGSTDGSAEAAERKYDIRLLRNGRNVGYCAGNNAGIRAANGEFLVLLNNDTAVHLKWLSELVAKAIRFGAGFCQPKILMFDDTRIINSTGILTHVAGFPILRGCGEVDVGQYDNETEISAVHGACIFASKDALHDVGLLDESFFIYNEDTDLGLRALLRGWKLRYVPSAIVYHKWGSTWSSTHLSTDKLYLLERNRLIMIFSNYRGRSLILLLPVLMLAEVSTLAYCFARGLLGGKVRAYADVIRMRHHVIERRRLLQRKRVIDDRHILTNFAYEFRHAFLARPVKPLNVLFKFLCRLLVGRL